MNRPNVEVTPAGTLVAADLAPGTTVYDPGLEHTAFARSAITRVDAAEGRLTYRGHDAVALARDSSFGEVARLLVRPSADLSTPDPEWNALVGKACRDVAEFAHPALAGGQTLRSPINYVAAGLAMVAAGAEAEGKHKEASEARELDAARLIASVRSLASIAVHGRRLESTGTADDPFALGSLLAKDGRGADAAHRSLGALLILYADHEMAASTTALRVAASAGAGIFASAAAAAATFGGRRHGGASDAVGALFERLADPNAVEAELDRVHRRETRLPGFGHRLHRGHDPRVVAIRALIADLPTSSTGAGFDAAACLEERVSADPYFEERGLFPNPDFYAVQLLMAIGFLAATSSAVLAVGRAAGWAAHWLEASSDRESRLLRPRQLYVGP